MQREPRINSTQASLMIATALLFDVISAIPAIGQVIADVGSFVIFLIWFLILGLPLISPKKIAVYCVSFVISIVPLLSILPEITLAIFAFILITRAEDALGVQVLSAKGLANPNAIAGQLKQGYEQLASAGGVANMALKAGTRFEERRQQRQSMDDMLPPDTTEEYA